MDVPRRPAVDGPSHERRAAVLRPVLGVAGALCIPLIVVGVVLSGLLPTVAGGFGWLLLTGLVVFGCADVLGDLKLLQRYPDLGRRQLAWLRAGASPGQLRRLNEAHRVNRLNPPVGYGDRRTLINPLADAYAIFTSPVWRDSWLADRQLVIDPICEAAEIIDYVHQVTSMLAEVAEQIRVAVPGSAAQQTYLGFEQALRRSVDDGLKRARALTSYRAELGRLAAVLNEQLALPAAEALADRVLNVLSESARQEMATRQLEDSRAQLQTLEQELREITELLNPISAHLG